jgi:hypothetical protein
VVLACGIEDAQAFQGIQELTEGARLFLPHPVEAPGIGLRHDQYRRGPLGSWTSK